MNSRRNLRNDSQLLKDYVRCHYEYYEFDQFDISFKQLDSINVNLENVVSEECIYKSYDLFRKCLWPVRFSSKFNARLQSYSYA